MDFLNPLLDPHPLLSSCPIAVFVCDRVPRAIPHHRAPFKTMMPFRVEREKELRFEFGRKKTASEEHRAGEREGDGGQGEGVLFSSLLCVRESRRQRRSGCIGQRRTEVAGRLSRPPPPPRRPPRRRRPSPSRVPPVSRVSPLLVRLQPRRSLWTQRCSAGRRSTPPRSAFLSSSFSSFSLLLPQETRRMPTSCQFAHACVASQFGLLPPFLSCF